MAENIIEILDEMTGPVHPIEMDQGIRRLVAILNSKGLATTGSCEGHYDRVGLYGFDSWIMIDAHAFKSYMEHNSPKMEKFLIESMFSSLHIRYQGSERRNGNGWVVSHDTKQYEPTQIRVCPTLVVAAPPLGWCGGNPTERDAEKTKWRATAEINAESFL